LGYGPIVTALRREAVSGGSLPPTRTDHPITHSDSSVGRRPRNLPISDAAYQFIIAAAFPAVNNYAILGLEYRKKTA